MATSVPVPIAMPRSAVASAGASLMPSPTKPTTCPLCAQPRDVGGLVGGEHLGDDVVSPDADGGGDGVRGRGVVTGEHPHLQAEGLELGDGFGGGVLDGVGDRDQAGEGALDGDVHRGLGRTGARVGLRGQVGGVDALGVASTWRCRRRGRAGWCLCRRRR